MRELVRAPYMAIRAVWTRTALPTADSHKFTQDYGFPGWLSLPWPTATTGYKLFFRALPYPACAGGPNLGMFYIRACISQRIVGQDIHARRIHVSTAGREKANRAYVRSRLLRHRIRKCSSFEHGGKTIDLASHSYGGNLFRNTNSFVFV